MNNHILKIKNLREIKQELQCSKRRKGSRNSYHPPVKCHFINSTTSNFRATHSKLFNLLRIKVQKLEECLRWLPKAVSIPLKKLNLEPKIKVTKRIAGCFRRDCYVKIRCHNKKSIGTYIRSSLDPNSIIWVKFDMKPQNNSVLQQSGKIALKNNKPSKISKTTPKNCKPNKISKQSKTMSYLINKGECIKEIYQANRLENIIRKYNSLNNPSITFREFNHAIICKVPLYPLETLLKKEVNITKGYLLRWKEVGYLSDFDEWADNPHDVPFLGPDQNLYKIIT